MPTPTLWNVPYQRNPYFTGREDVLAQLHRALYAENTVALSHPQGISGLGGIGKTQTALEYAYRYHADYDAVFWVRADSIIALTSSLAELARILELPERDEKDQEVIVQAVLRWLRLHSGWLLVYDNIDDLSIAEPFLPKAGLGHLLFTTRAHGLAGLAQRLVVEPLEPETGALLLLRRASVLPLQARLDTATSNDRSRACEVSQELDGLPLAIDQAGAYIKETPCLLVNYLTRYRTRRQDLLQARGSFNLDYPASVATTWSLSFEKVSQANPAASELLNLCAYLSPDAIPEEIITEEVSHLGPVLQSVAADPLLFDQAVAALLAYSLVERNTDNVTLSMHRLVQAVLRDTMEQENRQAWIQRVASSIKKVFPRTRFENWSLCERYIHHVQAYSLIIEQGKMMVADAAEPFLRAGWYLQERSQYSQAERLCSLALLIYEQEAGEKHLDTASCLNVLAAIYYLEDKYEKAESHYLRALSIYELLDPDGLDKAENMTNLALLYGGQGKYKEAETLYGRALQIYEKHLGPDHPDTAICLNNLAFLYREQEKYDQAEPLYVRALEIYEKHLDPEHPRIAQTLNNLAMLYSLGHKYAEAEPLLRRALAIREQHLGPNHPVTAISILNLGVLYRNQEKYVEAEPLHLRALSIREEQLGADHLDTAISLYNLGILYKAQERYEEAELLLRKAFEIRGQKLGIQHPYTIGALKTYLSVLRAMGREADAAILEMRLPS